MLLRLSIAHHPNIYCTSKEACLSFETAELVFLIGTKALIPLHKHAYSFPMQLVLVDVFQLCQSNGIWQKIHTNVTPFFSIQEIAQQLLNSRISEALRLVIQFASYFQEEAILHKWREHS